MALPDRIDLEHALELHLHVSVIEHIGSFIVDLVRCVKYNLDFCGESGAQSRRLRHHLCFSTTVRSGTIALYLFIDSFLALCALYLVLLLCHHSSHTARMWQIVASLIGFLAHHVSAHGGALNYTVGDTWYPGRVPRQTDRHASYSLFTNTTIATTRTATKRCKTAHSGWYNANG